MNRIMARQALGKGLGALLNKQKSESGKTASSLASVTPDDAEFIISVKTSELVACPFQPRRHFDEEQIAELAASIKERGLIQPIVVRRVEGKYEIIAGERRLRAVRSLDLDEIQVIVREASDLEVAELSLIENLQRANLTPLEEADQYRILQKKFNLKQEVIAKHVGKTRSVVANMIRLLDLESAVRNMLNSSEISVGHAKVLLQLKDAEVQVSVAERVVAHKLTVRKTEELVKSKLNPAIKAPKLPVVLPAPYVKVCKKLSKDFGSPVNISLKGKNNGVIEIPYVNKDDLERILQIFGITTPMK